MTSQRTIWFVVADLTAPSGEPFAVLKVDTAKPSNNGVEATVESLHWSREVAAQVAAQLQSYFDAGLHGTV